jgi:hypothetical protein
VVTIVVGGDGNTGLESILPWLIVGMWGWARGHQERRIVLSNYKH